MKQSLIKNKIAFLIIALIIISGIAVVALKGFNVEINYTHSKKIELHLKEKININEIKKIADEVLGKRKSKVQIIEIYEESVQITAKEITVEQKDEIVNKVNLLYSEGDENKKIIESEKVNIQSNSNVRIRDILRPYASPVLVSFIIILIYLAIRYYKLGLLKVLAKVSIITILPQVLLFSIFAVTRIPIGIITTPLILFVYVTSVIYISCNIDKR